MSHLAVADQISRKKEHEMRTLKRQDTGALRQGAPKGRKALYVWDRAGIDFRQWFCWKNQSAIYLLSRQKDNMKLEVTGEHPFCAAEPVNAGVVSGQTVGTGQGVGVRRAVFKDPETGGACAYPTNLPASIAPGLVALLYRSRWDIEKVFDEFKNKLAETKSWAGSATAKTIHANLLCLTHNLVMLFEEMICRRDGVRNHAELERREKRRNIREAAKRLSQSTVKFIRWLKNHLDLERDWDAAIARLSQIYQHS